MHLSEEQMEQICKIANIDDIGELSDGFHTFNSLYYQRAILFATIVNTYKELAWKSKKHEDGEFCFGGGWFIVVALLPRGQISNHYELKDWGLFKIPVYEKSKYEFDGHTTDDVIFRLESAIKEDAYDKEIVEE